MEVQDYQILDQYSDEYAWCPSKLLALIPYLCVLPSQAHSLCSSRWKNTPFCLNWYITRYFYYTNRVFYATHDDLHFSSESEERSAYWVGLGEHCGDA